MAGPWEKYGAPADVAEPTADSEAGPWARYQGSRLSQEDDASPIPNELIERGKATVDEATQPETFGEFWKRGKGAEIIRDREASTAMQSDLASRYGGGRFDALTEGSQAGLMAGYDDELTAGALAPIDAAIDWLKGDGFDIGRAYSRKQQALDERKSARREAFPTESVAGEVVGGLALGGTLAKNGVTVAGRDLPVIGKTGAAALEGSAYGAAYGSGEAKPGDRLEGALTGAVIGAGTGVAAETLGGFIARKVAERKSGLLPAKSSKELKAAAGDQFDASEASGVEFQPASVEKLGKRLKLAAGRASDKLRPKTSGYLDELDDLFTGKMSLEDFEEFRQVLGKEIKKASANDARTLSAMKRTLDDFADNVNTNDLTGDTNGVKLLRKARETWAIAKKTEIIENILDVADVKGSGKYTQSGFANSVRSEMDKLYGQIKAGKVKGFTDDEIKLVRQMAKGGSQSKALNALAKFAPRGPVSITLGQIVGSLFPGGNLVMPLAGAVAGAAKDRAAVSAAESLLEVIASGGARAAAPALPNPARPFIAGGVAASTEAGRKLGILPAR